MTSESTDGGDRGYRPLRHARGRVTLCHRATPNGNGAGHPRRIGAVSRGYIRQIWHVLDSGAHVPLLLTGPHRQRDRPGAECDRQLLEPVHDLSVHMARTLARRACLTPASPGPPRPGTRRHCPPPGICQGCRGQWVLSRCCWLWSLFYRRVDPGGLGQGEDLPVGVGAEPLGVSGPGLGQYLATGGGQDQQ